MSSELIKHVSDAGFENDVLKADGPVLVDYWAEWCGPCKMVAPILDDIAKDYQGRLQIAKMNVDENSTTPAKFGIRGIPTLMSPPRLAHCPSRSWPHSSTATSELTHLTPGSISFRPDFIISQRLPATFLSLTPHRPATAGRLIPDPRHHASFRTQSPARIPIA
jgi:thioredoxin 1